MHEAIHTVHLHKAKQEAGENVKSFAARVRGVANDWKLSKACSCGQTVSYLEETCYHVVLAGLRDEDLQERCTTQALLSKITDLKSLVDFCTAEESGKLGTSSTIGRIKRATSGEKKKAKEWRKMQPDHPKVTKNAGTVERKCMETQVEQCEKSSARPTP